MQALQRLSDMAGACAAATCRSCIELRTDEGSVPICADLHYSVSGSCGLGCMQLAAQSLPLPLPLPLRFSHLPFFIRNPISSHQTTQ